MSTAAEVALRVDGLRCAGCAGRVEKALEAVPGVEEARVNFVTGRALVRYESDLTDPFTLADSVTPLGYRALPTDGVAADPLARQEQRHALVRVLVAGFLAGNVMVIAIALYLGSYEGIEPETRRLLRWLAIALSVPAVTWCAAPFWRAAFLGLARRELVIDVPIALGIGTAFAVSVLGTLADSTHVFIDSAAVIVFLILLGRTLEQAARARAMNAVQRLLELAPRTALRRVGDQLERVPAVELAIGDCVVVPPGEAVPADGRIVSGQTELDEALLTGESVPVHRRGGDAVTAGTHNTLAEIEIEITARAGEGTLRRLARLLERAQSERPHVQRLVDRIAAVFAPAVLGVAALAVVWSALAGDPPLTVALIGTSVLIVACPCALALATPAAVTSALGRAARWGILFRSGEVLERCARVDSAVLDKTGTLTSGRLQVVGVGCAAGQTREFVLRAAAQVEGASTHPVAAAIRRELGGVRPESVGARRVRPGLGVEFGSCLVGTRELLSEHGIAASTALECMAERYAKRGATLAWVAREQQVQGVIAFADEPRDDGARAIERLRALSVRPWLVTGDHAGAARRAAERVGVERLSSGVKPEDKVACVREERAHDRTVLVAGDGINDAAALAAADVGIAFASGSEVTVQSADIVVMTPRLGAVPDAIELSRLTLRRIRQNLALAVGYNLIAVPLAVLGVLQPVHAAIAMSLSSLVVTGNAIRLLRWEPER